MLKPGTSRVVVGIAEAVCSSAPGTELITYALGSCLGVAIHDPVAGVGGLLHAMLPESSISPEKAQAKPAMFVDVGVPQLFFQCYKLGAVKERLRVVAVGCASFQNDDAAFQIGRRNITMLRKLLWKNGVLLARHDLGGDIYRTLSLTIGSGDVSVATRDDRQQMGEGRDGPGCTDSRR